jgi:hypothetical protein
MTPDSPVTARYRAGFQVHIRYGRRRLHSAFGRDPSVDGLYLELRAVTLPEGTPVDLEIEALGRHWLIPSVVTHRDQDGIGVSFIEPQPGLVAELAQAEPQPMPPPQYTPARTALLQRHRHWPDA